MFDKLSKNPSLVVFDASSKLLKRLKMSKEFESFKFHPYSLNPKKNNDIDVIKYHESEEVNQNSGEITALHKRSLLNGLAKYPYRSKYVLFKLSFFNIYFYLGLIGMLRRYIIGLAQENNRLHIIGIKTFTKNILDYYVVIKNPNSKFTNHFSISSEINYRGFLDYLNNSGKKYAVIRFFEKLPNRYRVGGDLDVLVEDELFDTTSNFLSENSGPEMIDMYSVTGQSNAQKIPYYTPYLAKKILNETVTHNGYSVPNPKHYLNSFIYHCLYHKGLTSGIPTKYKDLKISNSPDNNYLLKIKELSKPFNIDVGETLEELDKYMKSVGWRPHLDTLDLLSSNNKWLSKHVKATNLGKELCLVACVLKKGFFEHNKIEEFEKKIKSLKFKALNKEILMGDRLQVAYNHLRGGNWSATNEEQYSPQAVYLLVDESNDGYLVRKNNLHYNPRSKKMALRKEFDVGTQSHIHMTDNTYQSIEYVDVLYPGELSKYKQMIQDIDIDIPENSFLQNFLFIMGYKLKILPRRLKEGLMELFRSVI